MSDYRYKAFICYSHKDETWARWLHRALESYHIPRNLVGREGAAGKIPKKLYPIFRDREELSSAADLSDTVKVALDDSAALIVICSPHAVQSRWVNEEIKYFQYLGRGQRIYSVIVDGDPEATDPEYACFPPSLLIDLTGERHEPLAADARKEADGRLLANLKLLSSLLGISLEDLRKRDLHRRQRRWILATVAIVTVAVLAFFTAWFRITAEKSEELNKERRSQVEELVTLKLKELRTMFAFENDPEDLDKLKDWNEQELKELILSAGKGGKAPINYAMNLREQGINFTKEGKTDEALENFRQSWALIAVTYQRDRTDQNAFFELGQAEFWIAYVFLEMGLLDKAEDGFLSYAEITRRLVNSQLGREDFLIEVSYILGNIVVVERARGTENPDRMLRLSQSIVEYNQLASVLDPSNMIYRNQLMESISELANAQLNICDLEGALASREQQVSMGEEFQQKFNESKFVEQTAFAYNGLANVQEQLGNLDDAQKSYESSLHLLETLSTRNPEDNHHLRYILRAKQHIARTMAIRGNTEEAWKALNGLSKEWEDWRQGRNSADFVTHRMYVAFLIDHAWLAQDISNSDTVLRLLEEALEYLTKMQPEWWASRQVGNMLTLAAFRYWQLAHEFPQENIQALLPDFTEGGGRIRACHDASLAARKAIMFGRREEALVHTDFLIEKGYQEPEFIWFCKEYGLCEESH
jgi:tetratricopeptide (TPR) repeat protein